MTDEILNAIPHRGPMLLVDEVVERGEDTILCRKTFREDEFFFQGHYPDRQTAEAVFDERQLFLHGVAAQGRCYGYNWIAPF